MVINRRKVQPFKEFINESLYKDSDEDKQQKQRQKIREDEVFKIGYLIFSKTSADSKILSIRTFIDNFISNILIYIPKGVQHPVKAVIIKM